MEKKYSGPYLDRMRKTTNHPNQVIYKEVFPSYNANFIGTPEKISAVKQAYIIL